LDAADQRRLGLQDLDGRSRGRREGNRRSRFDEDLQKRLDEECQRTGAKRSKTRADLALRVGTRSSNLPTPRRLKAQLKLEGPPDIVSTRPRQIELDSLAPSGNRIVRQHIVVRGPSAPDRAATSKQSTASVVTSNEERHRRDDHHGAAERHDRLRGDLARRQEKVGDTCRPMERVIEIPISLAR
jgi:hypothetical protein